MEYQVLKSGKDIINKFKPIISIEQKKSEFKPKFRETASIDFLRSLGYEIYTSKETFKTNNFILKKLVLIYGLFHKVSILRGIVKLKNVQKKNYSFLIAIHKNYILKS